MESRRPGGAGGIAFSRGGAECAEVFLDSAKQVLIVQMLPVSNSNIQSAYAKATADKTADKLAIGNIFNPMPLSPA